MKYENYCLDLITKQKRLKIHVKIRGEKDKTKLCTTLTQKKKKKTLHYTHSARVNLTNIEILRDSGQQKKKKKTYLQVEKACDGNGPPRTPIALLIYSIKSDTL